MANDKLRREYVASGMRLGISSLLESLTAMPPYEGELVRRFGDDVYERMMRDGTVAGNLGTLVNLAMRNGVQWQPAVAGAKPGETLEPEQEREHEKAKAYLEEFQANIDQLSEPIDMVARELLKNALGLGSQAAETNWELVAGKMVLVGVKPKNRRSVAPVVDKYLNVRGFYALDSDKLGGSSSGGVFLSEGSEDLLPRSKFILLTYGAVGGDPRGIPITDTAYEPWWVKKHFWAEYFKHVSQFGSPTIVGFTPEAEEGAIEDLDDEETPSDTPTGETDQMLATLQALHNGTAAVFAGGSKVEVPLKGGDGKIFVEGFGLLDRAITYAMLGQVRATMEAEHGSRADSQGAKDILDLFCEHLQALVANALYRDLAWVWMSQNYGDAAARKYTPRPVLSGTPQEDLQLIADVVTKLEAADLLTTEQLLYWDGRLGHPVRDPKKWEERQAMKQADMQQAQRDRARLNDPQDPGDAA